MFHDRFPPPAAAEADEDLPDPMPSLRKHVRLGLLMVGLLLACLLLASSLVQVDGAVIAGGEVSPASEVKTLSHPAGGVIAALYVTDGTRVKAGDPLIRFDTAVSGVDASASGESLEQLLAQKARLEAERDGAAEVRFPPALLAATSEAARGEARLFALRRAAQIGEQAQLAERIGQLREQIASYEAQKDANRKQLALIAPELEGVRDLWRRKLVTINRLNELERTAVSLEGNMAALQADIAQTRARIAEIRQQAVQIGRQYRSDAGTALAETQQRIAAQKVRSANASDAFGRSILRAQAEGVVEQMVYKTVGAAVPPAEPILRIVPDRSAMTVEARISPADRDQLRPGLEARIMFPGFNRQTTPDIEGRLERISAEPVGDPRTGMAYYIARISLPATHLKLIPGMPAQAQIRTGDRSLLSYLTKPLRDQIGRAFREE